MEVVKSKPQASKFVYDKWHAKYGLSENATPKEKNLWWGKETNEYWVEGRFGLQPAHYFMLTQATIKTARGTRIRPVWRDLDDLIYGAYHEAKNTFWDLMVTKRREAGLSLTFGGIIPIWIALTNPGSTSLLTSADKTRLEEMYKDKLRVVFDGIDAYYRPGIISTRQTGYLHMGKLDKATGEISGLDSKIVTRDTVEQPTSLEAFRAMHVFLDEFFLHPYADKVYRSAQASTKDGFVKVAPIVMGGSAGESSVEGQKKGAELWKNAEIIKMLTVFLPGWMGIQQAPELDSRGRETGKILNFCPNGHSDEDAATGWIMQTRENLEKLEDKKYLESFIKQYPLSIQEVFTSNAKGALPQDVMAKLAERERILLGNPAPIERCDLVMDLDGKIQVRPSKNGKILMLERFNPDHKYIAGMDPIPFVSSKLNDGSDNCTSVKDLDTDRYVAIYKERALDPDIIMHNTILLQDYYGKAKVNVEVNRGGVILDQYKHQNRLDLLAFRPTLLGKAFNNGDRTYGWYKNDQTGERGNAFIIDYLRKFWDEIYFLEIIEEAKNYLVDNTDILDSMVSTEIQHRQILERNKRDRGPELVAKKIPVMQMINGKATRVWVEVKLQK
jgi:hypothetical protein